MKDPRLERTRLHNLLDSVVSASCAVICGGAGWEDIAKYGRAKSDWLKTFLELPNGIAAHDTFRRVFCLLEPTAFQECFRRWIDALSDGLGLKRIAIDGKTVRRSFDRATGKAALHLVSAWATEQHVVLGQVAVDAKSNEITAIPKLLELLDVSGAIVTIDALGCQKDSAAKIRAGGGDYVLTVKDNQPGLLDDIQHCFRKGWDTDFASMEPSHHVEEERGHGRIATRSVTTILHPQGIRDETLWQDLRALTRIVSTRQVADQEMTEEVRYYIGSKAAGAKSYARYIRSHWGIENGLHGVLDMSFDEDHCRRRTDHSAENFALLRRLALSLLKQNGRPGSVRGKRLQSGWDDRLLEEVLCGK